MLELPLRPNSILVLLVPPVAGVGSKNLIKGALLVDEHGGITNIYIDVHVV